MDVTSVFPSTAADTINALCAQAYGAHNMFLVGRWLQLGLIVTTMLCLPAMLSWALTGADPLKLRGRMSHLTNGHLRQDSSGDGLRAGDSVSIGKPGLSGTSADLFDKLQVVCESVRNLVVLGSHPQYHLLLGQAVFPGPEDRHAGPRQQPRLRRRQPRPERRTSPRLCALLATTALSGLHRTLMRHTLRIWKLVWAGVHWQPDRHVGLAHPPAALLPPLHLRLEEAASADVAAWLALEMLDHGPSACVHEPVDSDHAGQRR